MAFIFVKHVTLRLVFLLVTQFINVSSEPSVRRNYFVIVGNGDVKFPGNVVTTSRVLSPIDCGTRCQEMDTCTSFNVQLVTGQCELLTNVPLAPLQELIETLNWNYYEKSCQLPLRITAARRLSNSRQMVVADGGKSTYVAVFSENHELLSFTFRNAVSHETSDVLKSGSAITFLRVNNREVHLYISESLLYCTEGGGGSILSRLCPGAWPKSVVDVFGQQMAALISTKEQDGVWAFGKGLLMKLTLKDNKQLEITQVFSDVTGLPHGWKNIPLNIVAASWMNDNFTKSLLVTSTYYVIYDVTIDSIVERGQICL